MSGQPSQELTMANIAKEQELDESLHGAKKRNPGNYSTTSNGQLTLVTMLDPYCEQDNGSPQFRVYIPPSLRLLLLRTYHDCLIHPDDVSNVHTLIYEFFTWQGIRRDVSKYIKRYRTFMLQGTNAALVEYCPEDNLDRTKPITLDIIASEQKEDSALAAMIERAPAVFSTATNGSIELITARGKDEKYRIVIPASLQAKVLRTYHDCLVRPTEENNFESVLYAHFTWNGIKEDVENYVLNEGPTKEMLSRSARGRINGRGSSNGGGANNGFGSGDSNEGDIGEAVAQCHQLDPSIRPIGLDEIAKEQKRDHELRQLKKEEPFVFSTVRYGNTLLTTAQNFRDNKYRIVIPKRLQGRMLETYKECLLNPTPDRNFDTLLYNHFTWNGIHDDVDYYVRTGRIPDKISSPVVRKTTALKELVTKIPSEYKYSSAESVRDFDWETKLQPGMKVISVVVAVCCLLVLISSILFFEKGVDQVYDSLTEAESAFKHAEEMLRTASSTSRNYLDIQPDIQGAAEMMETFDTTRLCTAIPRQGSALANLLLQIRSSVQAVGAQLQDNTTSTEVYEIDQDLELLVRSTKRVGATLAVSKSYIDVARVTVIFIDIIVISLMAVCSIVWMRPGRYVPKFARKAVTIPVFMVFVVLCLIFSTLGLAGAMAGGDFCSNPDESSVAVVLRFEAELSPFIAMLMKYYITGCVPERRPLLLETLSSATASVGAVVNSTINDLSEAGSMEECVAGSSYSILIALLELTGSAIHGVYGVLSGLRDILACDNFNRLYSALVDSLFCNKCAVGLAWTFFASFSMALLTLVVVTAQLFITQH